MNNEWHDESAENVVVHLDEKIEMVTLEKEMVIIVDDGGCAWMALTAPPVAPPAAAAVGFVAVGGF